MNLKEYENLRLCLNMREHLLKKNIFQALMLAIRVKRDIKFLLQNHRIKYSRDLVDCVIKKLDYK